MRRYRGFLDLGHSGPWPADPGAIGLHGERESALVVPIVWKISHYLAVHGHLVHHSRGEELTQTLPLQARAQMANRIGADYLLSIHCNAGPAAASGFEAITTPGHNNSDLLADAIYDVAPRFATAATRTQARPMPIRTDMSDGDRDKEQHLAVLSGAHCPAVLLEMGFLTNRDDLDRLQDPAWIDAAARLIAGAVDAFCRRAQGPAA